jgi:hypothetical protein
MEFHSNRAAHPAEWPQLPPYDLFDRAEVLEHLYRAPARILPCVAFWLRPAACSSASLTSLASRLRQES